jgi:hypothetical protein
MKKKIKYKVISEDLHKSLVDFLDEVQFDSATEGTTEDMHKLNFCNWAISELLNSHDAYLKGYVSKKDLDNLSTKDRKPQPKRRDQYLDETFMDWNLPDMSDEDYEKLVDQFDNFLRSWEKNYNKDNEDNPKIEPIQERPYKPDMDDIMEWCELDEVSDFLKDDPELTPEERFELYYDERERRNPKKKGYSMNGMLKSAGIKPYKAPPKNSKN